MALFTKERGNFIFSQKTMRDQNNQHFLNAAMFCPYAAAIMFCWTTKQEIGQKSQKKQQGPHLFHNIVMTTLGLICVF